MILGTSSLIALEMYVRYLLILCAWLVMSCTNEFFPEGLYDYQVERLLSNGDSKIWNQQVNSNECQDSVRLLVQLVSANTDDSVSISEILRGTTCTPDTTLIGNADASSFLDGLLFTDSLNFADGSTWMVNDISAKSLTITRPSGAISYQAD